MPKNKQNYAADGKLLQIKAPERRPGYQPSMPSVY